MWPLWAHMISGVVGVVLFFVVVITLVYLYDHLDDHLARGRQHEKLFVLLIASLLAVALGCVLGWAKYTDDLKAFRSRPPAEAPAQ
jgi:flagellin-like protein